MKRLRSLSALALALELGLPASTACARSRPASDSPPEKSAESACRAPKGGDQGKAEARLKQGSPRARAAAQRGLSFLARAAVSWQEQNKCNGCHVQSVTLEALATGVHNQYNVPRKELSAIVDGILNLNGGARKQGGLSYQGSMYLGSAKSFGGSAFARYDQWVNSDLRHDLLQVAAELISFQQPDGSISSDYPNNLPVSVGPVQRAYQAAQTWRQAYDRSADDRWRLPIQRAESFLQKTAAALQKQAGDIQEVNYALLGLSAAGVGSTEPVMRALHGRLLAQQNHDGGWGYTSTGGEAANAFATGQTLYALRMLGMTDRDPAVERGTDWLIQHQQPDGGWGGGGFGKAEAMWGVLGLVSVDVLSVALGGLSDGQHVDGTLALSAMARDNQGSGVQKVELLIDDVLLQRACGDKLDYRWNTAALATGKHIVDILAENGKGLTSRRRLEVYAGPVFLTQIGTQSTEAGVVVSLRNIAGKDAQGSVELSILRPGKQGPPGSPGPKDEPVATLSVPGTQGPMRLTWNGKDRSDKDAPAGKYLARLSFRDQKSRVLQTEDVLFVRDTLANQRASYGEIQGQLRLPRAARAAAPAAAANTHVELVDEQGQVVQSVRTTSEGQYRFKNVDAGKYKVRVRKEGFAPRERAVSADKAQEAAADMDL